MTIPRIEWYPRLKEKSVHQKSPSGIAGAPCAPHHRTFSTSAPQTKFWSTKEARRKRSVKLRNESESLLPVQKNNGKKDIFQVEPIYNLSQKRADNQEINGPAYPPYISYPGKCTASLVANIRSCRSAKLSLGAK